MKIALAQVNGVVGDLDGNARRIQEWTVRARSSGAELVVFPEQTIPGYPARDLLELPEFVERNVAVLNELAKPADWNRGIGVVVGFAEPHGGTGVGLHNACALLHQGKVAAVGRKLLLPTYDVFDEGRYFDPGDRPAVADFDGHRVGLSICEDIWNDKRFWTHQRYARDPLEDLASAGAEVILNISASPFSQGKPALRQKMLGAAAEHHRRTVIYVNQVGGNDSLVFDGHSAAFAADGTAMVQLPGFEEHLALVDLQAPPASPVLALPSDEAQLLDALILGTRDYARKTGFESAVLGLSGGVDSALVATIAARALGPGKVTSIAMPSRFTAAMSNDDAQHLADNLGIRHLHIPIEPMFQAFLASLKPTFAGRPADVTEENLQARIRGALLMAHSNKFGALLLTTGNKSELSVGYCTLYGDMCGGLGVIGDLLKTTVYAVCRQVNAVREIIPNRILTRAPSAELRENQTDQDSLPPYEDLDRVLQAHVVHHHPPSQMIADGLDPALVSRVMKMVARAEYKRRQSAPVLRVSERAFGEGWRFPIAQKFS